MEAGLSGDSEGSEVPPGCLGREEQLELEERREVQRGRPEELPPAGAALRSPVSPWTTPRGPSPSRR